MSKQNGKGDRPRNCFSSQYRENFEAIDWSEPKVFCELCGKVLSKDEKKVKNDKKRCFGCWFNSIKVKNETNMDN